MKPSPFARLFAVLGFAALVGALLFSRDNKLSYRSAQASQPAQNQDALYASIQTLAAAPAPESKPDAQQATAQAAAKPESKP